MSETKKLTALEIAKEILSRESTQYEGKEPRPIEILAEAIIKFSEELNRRGEEIIELNVSISEKFQALKEAEDILRWYQDNGKGHPQGFVNEWLAKYRSSSEGGE